MHPLPSGPVERITIRAFRAIEDPESCSRFADEHLKVLTDVGISNVTKVASTWQEDPDVYVICAEHETLGMVGGVRLHVSRSPERPLPIEFSIGKMDAQVMAFIDEHSSRGVAEICGLWNAHRFANRGLPMLLGMAAVSLMNQLQVGCTVAVLARYTLRYALRLGMEVVDSVGEKGWFVYPKPGFWGIVMHTADPYALDKARPDLRQRVLSLRIRPDQSVVEFTGVTYLDVHYQLELKRGVIDLHTYRSIRSDYLRYTA